MKFKVSLIIFLLASFVALAQYSHTASFVAKLGTDTVIVETYHMLPNHLYGKAFLRYPQDQVGVFNFHFYPDGSIRHYSISFMAPDSIHHKSFGTQGVFCAGDTCTWYASWPESDKEYISHHAASEMNFIGGWTPTLSLIEWNCMRLLQSGTQSLPITMLNDYIGVRQVSIFKGNKDTIIFGGLFLEYTKIIVNPEGRILWYDGTGTPWNYIVTRHAPINVDEVAKRLSKTPKIGIPSPEVKVAFALGQDSIGLSYGKPSKRGRKIFGGVVPYDSIWRTGAGDPTIIDLPFDIQFGKTIIKKGRYSLYTIPRPQGWTLIFNSDLQQWPTDPDRSKDIAAIPLLIRRTNKPQEIFTIHIEEDPGGGIIKFVWDDTEAYTRFSIVKE